MSSLFKISNSDSEAYPRTLYDIIPITIETAAKLENRLNFKSCSPTTKVGPKFPGNRRLNRFSSCVRLTDELDEMFYPIVGGSLNIRVFFFEKQFATDSNSHNVFELVGPRNLSGV